MKLEFSGPVKIAIFDDYNDYTSSQSELSEDCNIILINEYKEKFLKYPTKISFQLNTPENLDLYLNNFSSSKRSSIKKRYADVTEQYEIEFHEVLTRDAFDQWLFGYKKFIEALDYGENKVDDSWFNSKAKLHSGLFFYNGSQIQGGCLIKKFDNKYSISYAWYGEELKKLGGSTAAVIEVIKLAIKNNIPLISFGQDKNLFGGHLSIGLHDFKTSWGSIPKVPNKTEIISIIVNKKPDSPIIFYTLNHDNNLEINKF